MANIYFVNASLNLELADHMYSSTLSRKVIIIKNIKIKLAISHRRVKVSYAI